MMQLGADAMAKSEVPVLASLTALLIEDSDDDVVQIRRLLDELDLDVHLEVVRDGVAALHFLLAQRAEDEGAHYPHLILLDLSLPTISGLEVLRRLKGEPSLADIPVIILSGTEDEDAIREGQALKAHTHITKPIIGAELAWIVRSVESYWPRLERLRAL